MQKFLDVIGGKQIHTQPQPSPGSGESEPAWIQSARSLPAFASCDSTYQPWSLAVLRVGEF